MGWERDYENWRDSFHVGGEKPRPRFIPFVENMKCGDCGKGFIIVHEREELNDFDSCPFCSSENTNLISKITHDLSVNNILFDDYTDDYENGCFWTQICAECAIKHKFDSNLLDDSGSGICGVKGCTNEADHYLDIQDNMIKWIKSKG